MGITKNYLSETMVRNIVKHHFPNQEIQNIEELTEGMFNAAFRIRFANGNGSILKVAPKDREGLMSNEINLMKAEVTAIRLMEKETFVKVAKVQAYDTSKQLCESDYLIMEQLEGENWLFSKDKMDQKEKDVIQHQVGRIQKNLMKIKGEGFGLLGDERRFDSLYEFYHRLLCNVLGDITAKNISIGLDPEQILVRLEKDRECFAIQEEPSLVHWDMWEGNIFIKESTVSGVIDWERAMWGEPFMDDRFRRHNRSEAFLKGFGKETFSDYEMRRINWYDLLLYITMTGEVTYRQYTDAGSLEWLKPLLAQTWEDLCK